MTSSSSSSPAPAPSALIEVCTCGDARGEHPGGGPCRHTAGPNTARPHCPCPRFTLDPTAWPPAPSGNDNDDAPCRSSPPAVMRRPRAHARHARSAPIVRHVGHGTQTAL